MLSVKSLVLGPFGPALGPGLDLTWDLDLSLTKVQAAIHGRHRVKVVIAMTMAIRIVMVAVTLTPLWAAPRKASIESRLLSHSVLSLVTSGCLVHESSAVTFRQCYHKLFKIFEK